MLLFFLLRLGLDLRLGAFLRLGLALRLFLATSLRVAARCFADLAFLRLFLRFATLSEGYYRLKSFVYFRQLVY